MNKEQAIQKMVEIAEDFNLQAMSEFGLTEDQVNQIIKQTRPQLYAIQGEIYNFFVEKGVIVPDRY
jgi:hypothetical protein